MSVSGFLLFAPESFNPQWPWQLTPLTGRVIAGWPLSFAVWAVVLALMDRWDDMKMGIGLNIFWLAALLATVTAAPVRRFSAATPPRCER